MEYISQHYTLNTFLTPPALRPTSPINSASSVNRGGHRDIEPLAQVMGSVLLSINNLSPTARLWQGVCPCSRSGTKLIGEWHEVPKWLPNHCGAVKTSFYPFVFTAGRLVTSEYISQHYTLNTFLTPPALRATSPINSASSVNRGGHPCYR